MTSEADFDSLKEAMQSPASGFKAMTDRDKLNRQPHRITVKTVSRSTTLESFLRSINIDSGLWTRIAWLNGRQLSTPLAAGGQVKVIQ